MLIFLIGCATKPTIKLKDRFPLVDDRVQKYIEQFDMYYRNIRSSALDNSLDVRYGIIKESKKAGGVYFRVRNFTKISSVHFNKIGTVLRQHIVFHELGHHVLRRHHDNRILKDGCPRSIMHSKIKNRKCYIKHHRYYIKELFYGFQTVR